MSFTSHHLLYPKSHVRHSIKTAASEGSFVKFKVWGSTLRNGRVTWTFFFFFFLCIVWLKGWSLAGVQKLFILTWSLLWDLGQALCRFICIRHRLVGLKISSRKEWSHVWLSRRQPTTKTQKTEVMPQNCPTFVVEREIIRGDEG